jgi:hypothetical protein
MGWRFDAHQDASHHSQFVYAIARWARFLPYCESDGDVARAADKALDVDLMRSAVGERLDLDSFESASYVGAYFVASQLLLVPITYAFTHVDWHAPFEGRLRWFRAT